MKVEIIFPQELDTVEKKRELLQEICEWGEENLENQYKWKFVRLVIEGAKITHRTDAIHFEMDDEADAMALKLTWC